jgi:hypothetical protein
MFLLLVHTDMIMWVFFMFSSSYCHELLIIHITQTLSVNGIQVCFHEIVVTTNK